MELNKFSLFNGLSSVQISHVVKQGDDILKLTTAISLILEN